MKRIAFAGGKPLGVGILKVLHNCPDVEIVGIFGNPKENKWYEGDSVAEYALKNSLPICPRLTPEVLKWLKADLLVVAYYDRILKADVISIPPMGCVNLHLALAEEYRGCYPTTWAIINGETRTGVTLHYIDEGIDTGDIIAQRGMMIDEGDTGYSLYWRLVKQGTDLFSDVLPYLLDGTAPRRAQVTTAATRAYKRQFPCHQLMFREPSNEPAFDYDYIRALIFPPFPMPYIQIGDKKYELREVT